MSERKLSASDRKYYVEEAGSATAEAVRLARARGLSDDAIIERHRQWKALPEPERHFVVLCDWLTVKDSYRGPSARPEQKQRPGDSMHRDGRRAGAGDDVTAQAIQRRLVAKLLREIENEIERQIVAMTSVGKRKPKRK